MEEAIHPQRKASGSPIPPSFRTLHTQSHTFPAALNLESSAWVRVRDLGCPHPEPRQAFRDRAGVGCSGVGHIKGPPNAESPLPPPSKPLSSLSRCTPQRGASTPPPPHHTHTHSHSLLVGETCPRPVGFLLGGRSGFLFPILLLPYQLSPSPFGLSPSPPGAPPACGRPVGSEFPFPGGCAETLCPSPVPRPSPCPNAPTRPLPLPHLSPRSPGRAWGADATDCRTRERGCRSLHPPPAARPPPWLRRLPRPPPSGLG